MRVMHGNNFLFPDCPGCDTTAGAYDGVDLLDLPKFWWTCPNCYLRCKGVWRPGQVSVKWLKTRDPRRRDILAAKIETAIRKLRLQI